MTKKSKKQSKAERIFDTIADVSGLLMALFYILYVTLLLIFDVGNEWLNYSMLVITIIYILFFVIKIFTLNRVLAQKNVQRVARRTLKYSKWAMRLINALFVILTLATGEISDKHIIAVIGIMVVIFSFIITILWDVVWFVVNRKLREIKMGWDGLSHEQKNKRIEVIITSFAKSLDNFTGLDIAKSVTQTANRVARNRKIERKQERKIDKKNKKLLLKEAEVELKKIEND